MDTVTKEDIEQLKNDPIEICKKCIMNVEDEVIVGHSVDDDHDFDSVGMFCKDMQNNDHCRCQQIFNEIIKKWNKEKQHWCDFCARCCAKNGEEIGPDYMSSRAVNVKNFACPKKGEVYRTLEEKIKSCEEKLMGVMEGLISELPTEDGND